ncbi:MAG: NAD-dependent epimerase/dehydratase family protein, partial [bacterium]
FATSSSIYGDHPELPKQEDRLGNPISPYAVSKRANELYASVFSMLYGIQTIGLRYFNVFGPRQDPNGPYAAVIPRFITGLLKYDHPVIYGDGSFTRDFTYVENIVHANQLAMVAEKEEAINKVYNIAGGERTAIKELANILNTYLSKFDSKIANIKIIHEKERLGDIPHSYADIENARRLLGYRAWVSVKEGLHRTCEWFQKQNLSPE